MLLLSLGVILATLGFPSMPPMRRVIAQNFDTIYIAPEASTVNCDAFPTQSAGNLQGATRLRSCPNFAASSEAFDFTPSMEIAPGLN
jgi:hypothetical protein